MKRFLMYSVAALSLAGCASSVPDSGTGVGFESYGTYGARQAQAASRASVPAPTAVDSAVLGAGSAEGAASDQAMSRNSGQEPLQASPSNPAPEVVTNSAEISDENDFQAVSAERDIQADAALIAQNRAQYQVIAPTALPDRPEGAGPNIVQFALQTNNAKGESLYKRSSLRSQSKFQRSCAAFASSDLAQEEFLAMGGPEKDRKGMDPDGDGFACGWDPAPFRAVRG